MSAISKRQRFEIFKRDSFQCVYCGRKPPEVLLTVDHLIAVSKGGGNDPINLATACQDCNGGKSNRPLTQLPPASATTRQEQQERLDQLRALSELSIAKHEHEQEMIEILSDHWMRVEGDDPEEFRVSKKIEASLRMFLKRLPVDEILDAIDIAHARHPECINQKYFCGVCWKKIRDREASKPANLGLREEPTPYTTQSNGITQTVEQTEPQ